MMAEAEYLARLQKLQDVGGKSKRGKNQDEEMTVEKFKIEDAVFETHGVETEHYLLLRYNALIEDG